MKVQTKKNFTSRGTIIAVYYLFKALLKIIPPPSKKNATYMAHILL